MISGIPYWRLSGFYFFYFALVGSLSPYMGLYLSDIGFSAYSIGLVNAVLMGTKIIAPNVWGWLCDYTARRLRIITLGLLGATFFFSGLFIWQQLIPILCITFLYGFFWNAVLSQFDTATVQYLGSKSERYSHVRVWGSVGFIVAVTLLGVLFDEFSIQYLIPISWLLLLLITCVCLSIREPPVNVDKEASGRLWLVLRRPKVLAFFAAAFLLQFSFGAYYSFFSLYLESYGYSRTAIGFLWALGVVAEVLLFLVIHKIMPILGVAYVLFWSLAFTAIRWLLIAFYADNITIIMLSQLLHAFSFGAAHAACIELVRRFFVGHNAGQGNALYSSMTFGVGGAGGALMSGVLWEVNPQWLFVVSASVLVLATFIAWLYLCGKQ